MSAVTSATIAAPTPVADPRHDVLWQVELFSTTAPAVPEAGAVSPRAAYQDALAGRAVLLDVRSDAERATEGALHPALPVRVATTGAELADLAGAARVHLVGSADGGPEPATFAGFDPGHPRVTVVRGGFAAWRAAGLPVATTAPMR
ncbi:rhodanese-like domain-containing protein [Agilicoccus flavus]|uniref:rhodanese-like domain-containing protein n=1 Tax=Agilicoccus flavus TaxID=2775968 RepID=UPI001CF61FCE|nr:hypothetical protein [Agilicoccus flavus]